MQRIFWGLLLIYLDFSFHIGTHEIGILPDFLGYFLIFTAARMLQADSPRFARLRYAARGMMVFSGCLYLMELLGLSAGLGMLAHVLSLVCTALALYLTWLVVLGTEDLQFLAGRDLGVESLRSAWAGLAICQMLSYLFLMNAIIGSLCSLCCLAANILFLIRFHRVKERYFKQA